MLKEAAVDSLWFTGEDSGHLNAEIRRVDTQGKTLGVFSLQPLARFEQCHISGRQFFLATEDLSIGAGSYNGPLTHVLDLSQPGRIEAVRDDKKEEIQLLTSLKSAWKIIPDGILEAYCTPDTAISDSVAFGLHYGRWRVQGGTWKRTERTMPGYEDFGDIEFPGEERFPK